MNAFGTPLLLLALAATDTPPAAKDKPIDYESELNDKMGKGITPEKNANVLLWKVLGPTPEGGTGMPAEYFKRLGIAEPPKTGDYFIGLTRYMSDSLKLEREEFDPLFKQQGWATARPWTAREYPRIAGWLKVNEKPLLLVHEATKRTEYYNPLVSRKTEKDPGSLIGALLPSVQKCRELAAALCARAMLRTSEGKYDEAWADLLACHRLGRLVARGGTLIEGLVGYAIEAVATNADLAYLESAKLTSKQIQDRLKDLQGLPPMPSPAGKIDLAERYTYFDSLNMMRRGGVGVLEGLSGGPAKKPTPEELKALAMIDWEPALKAGTKWYDRMVAALKLPNRADRNKELDKIEADLKALKKDSADNVGNLVQLLLGKDPGIGDILIALLVPAIRKVQDAHDRVEQIHANLRLAFALAAYQRDEGRYPAKLDDLAPKYIAAVPGDIFTGKSLVYRPEAKGYLLYSFGINGKDDGGRWLDDEPRGDDPRVRMPLPPLKKQ